MKKLFITLGLMILVVTGVLKVITPKTPSAVRTNTLRTNTAVPLSSLNTRVPLKVAINVK